MKILIVAAIRCSLMFLVPTVTNAISTQWDLDPISGDWNTADNWTPNGVPNGPADIATFGLSNTTNVSIREDTEVNGVIFSSAATNPYTITIRHNLIGEGPFQLTISGVGITNNSGITQTFVVGALEEGSRMRFTNSASAGNARIILNGDSELRFFNRSTAGSANISATDGGENGANEVLFLDTSTAGSAVIDYSFNNPVVFFDNSSAGNATLNGGEEGILVFRGHSTAHNSTITSGVNGSVAFSDSSTAGRANIEGNGTAMFFSGSSEGGTATIGLFSFENFFGSSLDISGHDAPGITIGSLEGDEMASVFLGPNDLTIGSNNLSTTFVGVIQDGGQNGSLTKIGSGTLILSGANTYTGDTNVNRGVLQVDGSITSNTFVNHRGALAGMGTVNGSIINTDLGTVRPGGALGAPGVLTVTGTYTQTQFATLMIQIAGVSSDQFSVLNVLGTANLNGFLDPVLLNGFVPTIGDSFTFLNYASLTGEFSHIKHQVFDNGTLQWSVIYEANDAVLTVEQHVPDQGSTFLLLALGLLGLVTFWQQLMREQF